MLSNIALFFVQCIIYIIVKEPKSSHGSTCMFNFVHKGIFPVDNRQYSHDFMLRLRYCEAACVRPADLELIPGVTDKTPGNLFTLPAVHELMLSLVLT